MAQAAARPGPLRRFLGDDGGIIRFAFYAMLAGTASVLYVDFRELMESNGLLAPAAAPLLPGVLPAAPGTIADPRIRTDPDLLNAPMTMTLEPGGVLALTGSIDVGAAERLRDELVLRGEYVQTVKLDSPGGSVTDALAMGEMIRTAELDTAVMAGGLCASSCPILLASGVTRRASPEAAIGVHQIYAFEPEPLSVLAQRRMTSQAMADAQTVTAAISRHLNAMGVKPEVWLHALETPPDRLYYFSAQELEDYALVTELEVSAPPTQGEPG